MLKLQFMNRITHSDLNKPWSETKAFLSLCKFWGGHNMPMQDYGHGQSRVFFAGDSCVTHNGLWQTSSDAEASLEYKGGFMGSGASKKALTCL